MKRKRLGCLIVVGVLLLSGCNSDNDNTTEVTETKVIYEDDYAALLPFQISDARAKYATLNTSLDNIFTIGEGLLDLSKEYFSPKTHAYRENQFLDYNALDAVNDSYGLLGRNSETNPIGLNPEATSVFKAKVGADITGPLIVQNIMEIDFYKSNELAGISIAIIIESQFLNKDTNRIQTIDEGQLKLFYEPAVIRVVKYLRDTHPEVSDNIPIYATVYDNSSSDNTLPGKFLEEAYFKTGSNATFSSLENQWVLFPTAESTELDSATTTYFNKYKSKLADLNLGVDTSIIGKGEFKDKSLSELDISVTAHAKTALEMNAIVQTLNENLSVFESTGYRIVVDITCDNTHVAMIERPQGTSKTTTISLLK